MLRAAPVPGSGFPVPGCVARHKRPEPRVRLGIAVGRARAAKAAMDLSDGLADALRQVAAASGVGVRIDGDALPIDPGAREWWAARGIDPVNAAVKGGDDYECCSPCGRRAAARCGRSARHVTEPRRRRSAYYEGPARARNRAGRKKRTVTEGLNTLRIAEAYWKRAIVTLCVARYSCLSTRFKRATRDPKRACRHHRDDGVAAGRSAAASFRRRVLQGRDDGVRRRPCARESRRPIPRSARRQRRPLETPNPRYSGVGRSWIRVRRCARRSVDLYLELKGSAAFGRRQVLLTVLRLGWSPENSIPNMSTRCSASAKRLPSRPRPLRRAPRGSRR